MKKSNLSIILVILVLTLSGLTTVYAAASDGSEKTQTLAVQALAEKIQTDLADSNVRVRLETVNQYQISNSQIGVKGSGVCLFQSDAEQLPVNFDVKIDARNFSVAEVSYDFAGVVSPLESATAASLEEAVTLDLLKKVAAEYQTSNVVIALDALRMDKNSVGENRLIGAGEARIGDFEWRKIQAEAQLNEKGVVKIIEYKIQE